MALAVGRLGRRDAVSKCIQIGIVIFHRGFHPGNRVGAKKIDEVSRAAKDRPAVVEDRSQTLVPASVTTGARAEPSTTEDVFGKSTPAPQVEDEHFDADSVFGKRKDRDAEA